MIRHVPFWFLAHPWSVWSEPERPHSLARALNTLLQKIRIKFSVTTQNIRTLVSLASSMCTSMYHHLMRCLPLNSLPATSYICPLLIFFTNSLDPDQARQSRAWFGSRLFDTLVVILKYFFEKKNLKKSPKICKVTQHARSTLLRCLISKLSITMLLIILSIGHTDSCK